MLDARDPSGDRTVNQDTRQERIEVKHALSDATLTFLKWSKIIEFIEAEVEHHKPNQDRLKGLKYVVMVIVLAGKTLPSAKYKLFERTIVFETKELICLP